MSNKTQSGDEATIPNLQISAIPTSEIDEGSSFSETLSDAVKHHSKPFETSNCPPSQIGRYQLLGKLGQGGMGLVFRAREATLDRDVALKVISAGRFASPKLVEKLRREAQSSAGLNHPNIVPVFEIDCIDDLAFFTMALVEGETLFERIKRLGPMPELEAAKLLRTIADAVDYAHRLGVLHLDLKPANILLDQRGEPHIADFGIARRMDAALGVSADEISGSPHYMAPEQIDPGLARLCAATDVYALGSMLVFMLTGTTVFEGHAAKEVMNHVLYTDPSNIRIRAPKISLDVVAIIQRCLLKSAAMRYPTTAELARDLACLVEFRPVSVRPLGQMGRLGRWVKREPRVAIAIGTAFFALSAGIVMTAVQAERAGNAARQAVAAAKQALAAQNSERQRRSKAEVLINAVFDEISTSISEETNLTLLNKLSEQTLDYFDDDAAVLTVGELKVKAKILMRLFDAQAKLQDPERVAVAITKVRPVIDLLEQQAPSIEVALYRAKTDLIEMFFAPPELGATAALKNWARLREILEVVALQIPIITQASECEQLLDLTVYVATELEQGVLDRSVDLPLSKRVADLQDELLARADALPGDTNKLRYSWDAYRQFARSQRVIVLAIEGSADALSQAALNCVKKNQDTEQLLCISRALPLLNTNFAPELDKLVANTERDLIAKPDDMALRGLLFSAIRFRLRSAFLWDAKSVQRSWFERYDRVFDSLPPRGARTAERAAFALLVSDQPTDAEIDAARVIRAGFDLPALAAEAKLGARQTFQRELLYALAFHSSPTSKPNRQTLIAEALSLIPSAQQTQSNLSLKERIRISALQGTVDALACTALNARGFEVKACG